MSTREEALQEGWAIFADWRRARAQAGNPLPPSCFCVLARDAIALSVAYDLGREMKRLLAVEELPEGSIALGVGVIAINYERLGPVSEAMREALDRTLAAAREGMTRRLDAYRERKRKRKAG